MAKKGNRKSKGQAKEFFRKFDDWLEKYYYECEKELTPIDMLSAMLSFFYRGGIEAEGKISNNYCDEEEIVDNADLLIWEFVLYEKNVQPKSDRKITYEQFATDYEKYWKDIRNINLDLQNGDAADFIKLIQSEENALGVRFKEKEKKRNRDIPVFLRNRAKDFFLRFVNGKNITKESEILYFQLFAIYLASEDTKKTTKGKNKEKEGGKKEESIKEEKLVEKPKLSESHKIVKKILNNYKRNNEYRVDIVEILIWSVVIAEQIVECTEYELTYSGVLGFLNNFEFKKRLLKITWKEYYNESMETSGEENAFINPDFFFNFETWANENVAPVRKKCHKNGRLSENQFGYVEIVRNFFHGKKYKCNNNTVDERVGELSTYEYSTITIKGDEKNDEDLLKMVCDINYKKLWTIIFEMLGDNRDTSFLSIMEHNRILSFLLEYVNTKPIMELCMVYPRVLPKIIENEVESAIQGKWMEDIFTGIKIYFENNGIITEENSEEEYLKIVLGAIDKIYVGNDES